MKKENQRKPESYMNWTVDQMEEMFEKLKVNAKPYIRRTIKEDKSTGKHKELGVTWNGIAYSDELLPLDTEALKQAIQKAKDKKWAKRKDRYFVSEADFDVPDKTIVGFVYMIRFAKGFYYIGETINVNARMTQHRTTWKRKVMNMVNRERKEIKPEDLAHAKEARIRADRLLEGIKSYFIKSGEISKGTVKLTDAIRKGKITEGNLKDALKDITTNHVAILDVQVEGQEERFANYKAMERVFIGLYNSMSYELVNHNFAAYSTNEAENMVDNAWKNLKYPWDAELQGKPVGYHFELKDDTWDIAPW